MAKQTIGIGSSPNDGTGDPLRTAFDKINDNFNELYSYSPLDEDNNITILVNTISSTNTNGNIVLDPNGTGKIVLTADRINVTGTYTPATAQGAAGDTAGDVAFDGSFMYYCTADYDGSTAIWVRATLNSF